MNSPLVDTHIHLGAPDYKEDFLAVLERARAAGVTKCICIGAGYGASSMVDALHVSKFSDDIYASVAVHPCEAHTVDFSNVVAHAQHPKVVAIGETGLDFFRTSEFRPQQEEQFRLHIQLARQLKKPIIVHSRAAGQRCLEILLEEQASDVGGVFHCYAEDVPFANKLRAIGFLISVPGIITFKNAHEMRAVIKEVPLEQMMLETDGPFLAPQRVRGKRAESMHVKDVAEAIAQVKGLSLEEVAMVTTRNAVELFKITV